jgi:hypothetical protein
MTAPSRIRWTAGTDGTLTGYVGELTEWLFQVTDTGAGWKLSTMLRGHLGEFPHSPDPAKLQHRAETWLAGFVKAIGAEFTAP